MPHGGAVFQWAGLEVEAKVLEKTAVVITNMTRAAANYARQNHPWNNDSGQTEASIFSEPARIEGLIVKSVWGAGGAALYLEFGTHKMPAYPFLRPAADATYRIAHFAGALGVSAAANGGFNFPPSIL